MALINLLIGIRRITNKSSDMIEKFSEIDLSGEPVEVVLDGRNDIIGDELAKLNTLNRGIGPRSRCSRRTLNKFFRLCELMMKKAFITGVTGQDGSYLAELLLEMGYETHAILRRSSVFTSQRIEHILKHPGLVTYHGDLSDLSNLHLPKFSTT